MKTTAVAASAIVALLLVGVGALAMASNNSDDHQPDRQACRKLTIGEALSITMSKGQFFNASNHQIKGKANGNFTFRVSQTYVKGCVLSITSGAFKLGSTTYTITGGSLLLNKGGHSGEGWGTTTAGSFLIRIDGLQGNSTSAHAGAVGLDFKTGTSEFLAQLYSPK